MFHRDLSHKPALSLHWTGWIYTVMNGTTRYYRMALLHSHSHVTLHTYELYPTSLHNATLCSSYNISPSLILHCKHSWWITSKRQLRAFTLQDLKVWLKTEELCCLASHSPPSNLNFVSDTTVHTVQSRSVW